MDKNTPKVFQEEKAKTTLCSNLVWNYFYLEFLGTKTTLGLIFPTMLCNIITEVLKSLLAAKFRDRCEA